MIIRFNKKTRDDIVAIINFINEYPEIFDEKDFLDFIIGYEYYPVYYKNYHIFRDLIKYHNDHVKDVPKNNEYVVNDPSLESLLGLQ